MSRIKKNKTNKNMSRTKKNKSKQQSKIKINKTNKNIKTNKLVIISHYNDTGNIFHIFNQEIMKIWQITKGNPSTIIILKNFENNQCNKWRLQLLKQIYKKVFEKEIPEYIQKDIDTYKIINILQEKYPKWCIIPYKFNDIPSKQNIIEYNRLANTIKYNIYGINYKKPGNKVGFIYRESTRILYDYNIYKKQHKNVLVHKLLESKLKNLNIPFKSLSFENKTFLEQAEFLKDVNILISCHGAALTNVFLLPPYATVLEISFHKYWFCDPVCKKHVSGELSYKEDCKTPHKPFHKYEFHNLSKVFMKKHKEIIIEDANEYVFTDNIYNHNQINLKNIYIDTDNLVTQITKIY